MLDARGRWLKGHKKNGLDCNTDFADVEIQVRIRKSIMNIIDNEFKILYRLIWMMIQSDSEKQCNECIFWNYFIMNFIN